MNLVIISISICLVLSQNSKNFKYHRNTLQQATRKRLIHRTKYLFDLIFMSQSMIFQLCQIGSSWVGPVLSKNLCLAQGHKAVTRAQWLSSRLLDSRPRGRGFEPHRCHCLVYLSKNINHSLVLVQPRKTCPFITERLLMGCNESNQTNKNKAVTPVRLESTTPQSQVKHFTTELPIPKNEHLPGN